MSTPYGYKIQDGKAIYDTETAGKIKLLFRWYLEGLSIKEAADRADLKVSRSTAGKILKNHTYLGDDFYPAIIDEETFSRATEEREKRYAALGSFGHTAPVPPVPVRTTFRMVPEEVEPIVTEADKRWNQKYLENMRSCAKRAAYLYSRIQYDPEGNEKLRSSDKTTMLDWMEEHADFTARW